MWLPWQHEMGVQPEVTRTSLTADLTVMILTVVSYIQWADTVRNTNVTS
jgi:hypothetical protein